MAQIAARVFKQEGERLGAGDIHKRMERVGWQPSVKASLASLRTSLYREHDKSEGLIVRSEEKGKFELRSSHNADATRGEGEEGNTN